MPSNFIAPKFQLDSFTCVHCHAIAQMHWVHAQYKDIVTKDARKLFVCFCQVCGKSTIWKMNPLSQSGEPSDGVLIDPIESNIIPSGNSSLPEKCLNLYNEARSVFNTSKRCSAVLLRICLEQLLRELNGNNKNINENIQQLLKSEDENLRSNKEYLEFIRVIGNSSAHAVNEINLDEDPAIAENLFHTINIIAEDFIERPNKIKTIIDKLPPHLISKIRKPPVDQK